MITTFLTKPTKSTRSLIDQNQPKHMTTAIAKKQKTNPSPEITEAVNLGEIYLQRACEIAGVKTQGEFQALPRGDRNAVFAQMRGEEAQAKNPAAIVSIKSLESIPNDAREQLIALALVDRSPFNRETFNPDKSAELISSIRAHGVLQAGIARPSPHTPGRFELVAGERRMNGSVAAGLTHMPLKIKDLTDEQAIEVQAIENFHREDLNPLDEAIKYEQFIEILERRGMPSGVALDHVCERLGKSKAAIYESRRLLKLPEIAQLAIRADLLPPSHAGLIGKLEKNPDLQKEAVKRVLKPENNDSRTQSGIMSFRATREMVEKLEEKMKNLVEYEKVRAEFMETNDLVLTAADNKELFPYNSEYMDSKNWAMLDLNSGQQGIHQWDKWSKLVGKKSKLLKRSLAQYPSGKPAIIYSVPDLRFQAMSNGVKWGRPSNGANASEKAEREKAKRTALVRDAVLLEICGAMNSSHTVPSTLIWELITFAIADHCMHSDSAKAVARRRQLNTKDAFGSLKGFARQLSTEKELQSFAVELLVGGGCYYRPDVLKRAALTFNIDMAAIEQRFQASGK